MKTRKNYNISAETFTETWNRGVSQGKSAQEIADELGMEKNIVLARKSNYIRKHGIPLLPIKRASRKLDTTKLIEVAKNAIVVSQAEGE